MPPCLKPMKPPHFEQSEFRPSTNGGKGVHPAGCSDPNCFLPACINIKLRKSHLQRCKKKSENCDICKQLTRGTDEKATLTTYPWLVHPPVSPAEHGDVQARERTTPDDQSDEEISIIKIITGFDSPKKNLPESYHFSPQVAVHDVVGSNQNSPEQRVYNAIVPHDKRGINFCLQQQQQEQSSLIAMQLSNALDGNITPCNQVIMPKLEVLCKALQALNTVIQLVKSSQLELHAIPLLEQALAEMKITAFNRLDDKIRPTPLPITSTPVVMEYCESEVTGEENRWLPLQSPEPPLTPSPSSASSSPPSSAGPLGTEYPPSLGMSSSRTALYKTNSVVELCEDVADPDSILLDFMEELLG